MDTFTIFLLGLASGTAFVAGLFHVRVTHNLRNFFRRTQ